MLGVKVVDHYWFNTLTGMIGIVLVETPNGSQKCFIGSVDRMASEQEEAAHIVQYGAVYPLEAAKYFFPYVKIKQGF